MEYIAKLPPLLAYTPVPPQPGEAALRQLAANSGAPGAAAAAAASAAAAAAAALPLQVAASYACALTAVGLLVAPPSPAAPAEQRQQEEANRTANQGKLLALGTMQHLLVLSLHAGGVPSTAVRAQVGGACRIEERAHNWGREGAVVAAAQQQ